MKLKEGQRKNAWIYDFKDNDNIGFDSFSNICFVVCSEAENGIRRSNFLRTCNVPCIWNNFYMGIDYDVVAGDYANYPILENRVGEIHKN